VRVRARGDAGTVRSERSTPNSINTNGRAQREFGKLSIPREGDYQVTVRSDAAGSNAPASCWEGVEGPTT